MRIFLIRAQVHLVRFSLGQHEVLHVFRSVLEGQQEYLIVRLKNVIVLTYQPLQILEEGVYLFRRSS